METSAAPASRCQECGCRIESCDNGLCDDCYVVSDPFRRRWGITVFWTTGAPFFSLGIHIDLHTPTVDLHVGSGCVQIGRNMWNGKRFVFATQGWSGHTDNCDHQRSEVAA